MWKNNVIMQHKNRHFCFSFCLPQGLFFFVKVRFSSWNFHNCPIVRWIGGDRPDFRRVFVWSGYTLSTLSEWKLGFRKVSFAWRFRTADGIARRIPNVWVLPLPTHFNWFSWFIKTPNYRSPSRDQLVFISRKVNSSWHGFNLFLLCRGGKAHIVFPYLCCEL